MNSAEPCVRFAELPTAKAETFVGRATLNSPKSLNSLTLDMITALREKFSEWKSRRDIVAIWLEGAGDKAFCAGGDIIKLYEAMVTGQHAGADTFFEQEYSLDLSLHQMRKPLIVWGDGVVMGGGMGLMQGAKFRIVTERTMMAMPEITIGLYPDVGASYFLHKSPEPLGLFAALTGARLGAADALKMNFADQYIPSNEKESLIQKILGLNYRSTELGADAACDQNMMLITDLLMKESAAHSESMPPSQIERHQDWIAQTFSLPQLTAIDAAIRAHTTDDKWLSRTLGAYRGGSPTSAALIFEQLRRSRDWSLEDSFATELFLSANCARAGELQEGIRALLVDKDNAPQWKPATLAEVSTAEVAKYFQAPPGTRLELKWMI